MTHDVADFDDADMMEAVARAEREIRGMRESFLAWITEDLARLDGILGALIQARGQDRAAVRDAFDILHNIKGQAATFGYELVSEIGEVGCMIMRDNPTQNLNQIKAVQACCAAIRSVLHLGLEGDGGARGRELIDRLAMLAARVLAD